MFKDRGKKIAKKGGGRDKTNQFDDKIKKQIGDFGWDRTSQLINVIKPKTRV